MSDYIRLAVSLASTVIGRFKVAAILFDRKGNLLTQATNNYLKSHPMQKHYAERVGREERCFLHAEIAALLKLKGRKAYKLLLVRVNKKGRLLPVDPCPVCTLALKEFGIKIIERPI